MRRNTSRGRGSVNRGPAPGNRGSGTANRGPGPRGPARDSSASASGPLMTEHITVHDLDLELALLQRKRELIEQQQNILMSDRYTRPSPFDHNESFSQQYNEPQRFNRTSDFSQLYNNSSDSHYNRQQGRKRQAEPWQNHAPQKRFSGPQRSQKPSHGPRASQPETSGFVRPNRAQNNVGKASPQSQSFPPLMGYGYKPKPAQKPRKNFNPTKVTKNKPEYIPNRLDSLPVAERKTYIDQASNLVKNPEKNSNVLQADTLANRQLVGRLELALGSILKELKLEYGEKELYVAIFKSMNSQRVMKQVIRERIRINMLGKTVGPATEIVKIYRSKYPKETDIEILNLALETSRSARYGDLAIKPIESENPETYFKVNFSNLLSVKLDQMFRKLKDVYENDPANRKTDEEMEALAADSKTGIIPEVKDSNVNPKPDAANKSTDNNIVDLTEDAANNLNGTVDPEKDNAKADEEQEVTNIAESKTGENKPVESASAENKPEESKSGENKPEESTSTENKPESDEYKPEEPTTDEDPEKSKVEGATESPRKKDVRIEYYNILIDEMLKRKLPAVLPKYKEHIMRILNVDAAYKKTKAAILLRANEKAGRITERAAERNRNRNAAQKNAEKDKTPGDGQEKPVHRNLQYFVKIIGRPTLPRRPAMRSFLDSFNPASIKKHRGIHNLLFVGFAEKSDFDKILEANKSVIGNSTVEIKVSEKFQGNNKRDKSDADISLDDSDVQIVENKNEPITIDETKIDSDLDCQISDLLTSIQEEEDKTLGDETTQENEEKPPEDEQNNAEPGPVEAPNGTENTEAIEVTDQGNGEQQTDETAETKEVEELKNDAKNGKGTPTRASTRLASTTPSTIKTRRASKLAQ